MGDFITVILETCGEGSKDWTCWEKMRMENEVADMKEGDFLDGTDQSLGMRNCQQALDEGLSEQARYDHLLLCRQVMAQGVSGNAEQLISMYISLGKELG